MAGRLDVPLIICPGLARSGTTYLYNQLTLGSNNSRFNVPNHKETVYFNLEKHPNYESFASQYEKINPGNFFLDFSLSYLLTGLETIRLICSTITPEKTRLILHLRSPLEQAFSHYLHDLKVEIAPRLQGDEVEYSFYCQRAQQKYVRVIAPQIELLINTLGLENIFVVNFYKDINNPQRLRDRLTSFLGVQLDKFSEEPIGAGGWMPYYLYGESTGEVRISENGEFRIVPSGVLYGSPEISGHECAFDLNRRSTATYRAG